MLVRRRAAFRILPFAPQPEHSAAAPTRLRSRAERRVHSKKRGQVLIAIEINRAEAARSLAKIHGHVDLLGIEYSTIGLRFRALKRPLDVRDQRLLRSPFAW